MPFPRRDWFGPLEELVPIATGRAPQAEPGEATDTATTSLISTAQTTAEDFWSGVGVDDSLPDPPSAGTAGSHRRANRDAEDRSVRRRARWAAGSLGGGIRRRRRWASANREGADRNRGGRRRLRADRDHGGHGGSWTSLDFAAGVLDEREPEARAAKRGAVGRSARAARGAARRAAHRAGRPLLALAAVTIAAGATIGLTRGPTTTTRGGARGFAAAVVSPMIDLAGATTIGGAVLDAADRKLTSAGAVHHPAARPARRPRPPSGVARRARSAGVVAVVNPSSSRSTVAPSSISGSPPATESASASKPAQEPADGYGAAAGSAGAAGSSSVSSPSRAAGEQRTDQPDPQPAGPAGPGFTVGNDCNPKCSLRAGRQ
ncbi:MAG: hypothetical protein ABSG43_19095 [Solirubrobacteraceae bacterium]